MEKLSIKERSKKMNSVQLYLDGLDAYREGKDETDCPYSFMSSEYFDWQKGYNFGLIQKQLKQRNIKTCDLYQ